jgi:hypothetical protein
MGSSTQSIKKTGRKFPINAYIKVASAGNPIRKPKGMAPLNSVIGSIDENKTINSGGMFKCFVLYL